MQWLNKIVDELTRQYPDGEILVESGVSPSGTYHVGTLREVLTADAIMLEIRRRGRQSRHIHYCDDLDPFRKVPVNVPAEFEKYLGRPLCDVPSLDGQAASYGDYFLNDFLGAAEKLHMDMVVMRGSQRYRNGEMAEAVEMALVNVDAIREVIQTISGRQLEKDWAPIQVNEDGYLKNRRFVSIDTDKKTVTYLGADNNEHQADYSNGDVKLTWRVDWPARWWQLGIQVEPFGRDHATKGGSYDTGAGIIKAVYKAEPPMPVGYNFINLTGETKKMSKSTGNIISISELTEVLPPEVIRYFVLRYPPEKQLFFDQANGVMRLIDEFAAFIANPNKTAEEQQLAQLCTVGHDSVVSTVPFSHLVTSYQAANRDSDKTLQIISRTEHAGAAEGQADTIKRELTFIDQWLKNWAPEDVKFNIEENIDHLLDNFSDEEKDYLRKLSEKIEQAPADADAEWFHKAVYSFKESDGLSPQQLFAPLYKVLINKEAGPRAGYFLNDLNTQDHDRLVKRLKLEQ
jgi:lysyl-tRNA synthetase class 1